MNLKPTRGKLLAELLLHEQKSSGGVSLPDKLKERVTKARVIAVGPPERYCACHIPKRHENRFKDTGQCLECKARIPYHVSQKGKPVPNCAEVGNIVHFKRWFGKPFKWEGKKMIALKGEEIVGVEV